jgi:hypothetical protein
LLFAAFSILSGLITIVQIGGIGHVNPGLALSGWIAFGVAMVLALALHEAGHVLGAWAGQLQINEIGIGPLRLSREMKGFRCRWRVDSGPRAAGYVSAFPTGHLNLTQKHFWISIGGPAASLLVGLVCLCPALILNYVAGTPTLMTAVGFPLSDYWVPRSALSGWLMIAAILNLEGFFLSIIPMTYFGTPNDAAHLIAWMRDPSRSEQNWILQSLWTKMAMRTRAREWDPAMVERMLELRQHDLNDATANLFGYYHALDRGETDRAGQLLDLALSQAEGCPLTWRALLFAQGVQFEALVRKNPAMARKWLEKLSLAKAEPRTYLCAEAAVLFVEQRYTEAIQVLERAMAALPVPRDHGSEAEHEWLLGLLAQAKAGGTGWIRADLTSPGSVS